MFVKLFSGSALAALCASLAMPASAQDNEATDWQLNRMPSQKATVAVAEFDNGLTLVTRCVNNAFDVTIDGLPETNDRARLLQISVGEDARMRGVAWSAGANKTSAFSRFPLALAHDLMRGGTIRIRIPASNGRPSTLYVMDTEPSVAAIAETLTACDKPLIDPRNEGVSDETLANLPFDMEWIRLPMPSPDAVARIENFQSTHVTVSCLTADEGRLTDCRIESAHPFNANINRLVLDAARRGRLRHKGTGEAVEAGREISYGVPISIG